MQILPKPKAGIANCGYVIYEGNEKVTDNDINQRLNKNIEYKKNIGLINIKSFEFSEPQPTMQISDNRIKEYAENQIRYYLLCNFTLNELLELAKSISQNNISEIFDFLFNSQKLPMETIIEKLKEVSKI